ncbi:MAG: ferrous iron transport protein B, partial [Deltaproteobacteria bacterium]|nr:ferrous iron transport protein B [Deltaproteobacteria bacterium]
VLGFLRRDYGIVTAVHGVALSANQLLVVIATITLFIPCVAQFFMVIKEQGVRRAFLVMFFVIPFALLTGGVLNFSLKALNIDLGQ